MSILDYVALVPKVRLQDLVDLSSAVLLLCLSNTQHTDIEASRISFQLQQLFLKITFGRLCSRQVSFAAIQICWKGRAQILMAWNKCGILYFKCYGYSTHNKTQNQYIKMAPELLLFVFQLYGIPNTNSNSGDCQTQILLKHYAEYSLVHVDCFWDFCCHVKCIYSLLYDGFYVCCGALMRYHNAYVTISML